MCALLRGYMGAAKYMRPPTWVGGREGRWVRGGSGHSYSQPEILSLLQFSVGRCRPSACFQLLGIVGLLRSGAKGFVTHATVLSRFSQLEQIVIGLGVLHCDFRGFKGRFSIFRIFKVYYNYFFDNRTFRKLKQNLSHLSLASTTAWAGLAMFCIFALWPVILFMGGPSPSFSMFDPHHYGPKPLEIHVAPFGNDYDRGTFEEPVQTMAGAVHLIKSLRLPVGGIEVLFRSGTYHTDTVVMDSSVAGTQVLHMHIVYFDLISPFASSRTVVPIVWP